MKKIIALVMAVLVLVIALAGCGEDASAAPDSTESATVTVAVDTSELMARGEITIFNGTDFIHEGDVVDYVSGDPAHLDPFHDVYGIYAIVQQGTGKTVNKAVLTDGAIASLETEFKLLPRDNFAFILDGVAKDDVQLHLTLQSDNTYAMSIARPGVAPVLASQVIDAWKARGAIYWLSHDVVYRLNLRGEVDSSNPEAFCEGAYGVSHGSDESQGALVPFGRANAAFYGRSDIFSPYGDKLTKR